ncbi:AGZA family xanthine/uracil permease-like MFS transporter [Larkinella arboricola]|uniref:AGZA family xanthine/uracil permease-like MFS transporter n=1 Tax=Larkinella arboricola TaxID=643671 RepID=A0A327WV16_LARAB|nr:NCS2 family permease [Larkinella arboricola]RAJ95561.1 AGZA family xanthine/uracil permease-like MFS transporter [Larkinella arboricola]
MQTSLPTSSTRTEILAGISSFLATMYIIVVNPSILSQAGLPFSGVLTATVLLSFGCSVLMGLYARNPLVVAPGMGLNAFFTFTAVKGMGIRPEVALGAVFWAGILFLILSVFNVRSAIVKIIPKPLRYAISAGIGLFITLIGFENARFIVGNPATLVSIASLKDPVILTFIFGLLITCILVTRNFPGAIIIGIALTTLAALPIGRWWGDASAVNFGAKTLVSFQGILATPDFSLIGKLDFVNSLQWALWPVIFAFVFTDLFDSLSTFVGVAEAANLYDEDGNPRNLNRSLTVDAVATAVAGLLGTSPGTSYVESAVGVAQGGRTGLTAIVAGALFLPFLFLSPLLSVVPAIATAPALVLVGSFMMKPVTRINWDQLDDALPAFLALVLIPFSYSITQGIIWGFLTWTVVKLALGKSHEVPIGLLIVDAFCILALFSGH